MEKICELNINMELLVIDDSWANIGKKLFKKGALFTVIEVDSEYAILLHSDGAYIYARHTEIKKFFDCVKREDIYKTERMKYKGSWVICDEHS